MKKIRLQTNFLEIPIVDENDEVVYMFRFDKRDENIKRFEKMSSDLEALEGEIKSTDDYESAREITKRNVDFIFGDGTFDALYQLNPSLSVIAAYFFMACQYIRDDLDVTNKETLAQYLYIG